MANAMKTTSELSLEFFLRTLDQTSKIVSGIGPDQWKNATPCAEWDMRALVNHITGENLWIAAVLGGATIASVGDSLDGDLVGDDPAAMYLSTVAQAKAAFSPERLVAHYGVSFGDISGYDYASQLFMDQLVHSRDVLMGSRQQVVLDEGLLVAAIPVAQEMVAFVGQGSVFGNTLNLESSPSNLEILVGTVGRSLAWKAPEGATFK